MIIRKAFVMQLKPGAEEEYERRHNPIWPELEREIRAGGVRSYSIFFHPQTRQLFAYLELDEESKGSLSDDGGELTRRWWRHMAPLMETNPDSSPCTVDLREVFHLD